jgi:hypothetical protein
MIMTNKIVAVALITALVGASLGAAIMHSRDSSRVADTTATTTTPETTNASYEGRDMKIANASDQRAASEFKTSEEQSAYKIGFADGFQSCAGDKNAQLSNSRVAYRNAYRGSSSRRVYYDYNRSRGRSFWSKHRDKLTLAMGTGGGALIGGLIGGKKGAGIGALAGLGGSALYTYKLRHRNNR